METVQDIAFGIDWSEAPAWANFVAADYDEARKELVWYWFAERPERPGAVWWPGLTSMNFEFEFYKRTPASFDANLVYERPDDNT